MVPGGPLEWQEGVSGSSMDSQKAPYSQRAAAWKAVVFLTHDPVHTRWAVLRAIILDQITSDKMIIWEI